MGLSKWISKGTALKGLRKNMPNYFPKRPHGVHHLVLPLPNEDQATII